MLNRDLSTNLQRLNSFDIHTFTQWLLIASSTGAVLPFKISEDMHIAEFLSDLEKHSSVPTSSMMMTAITNAIFSWKPDVHGFIALQKLSQCMSYLKAAESWTLPRTWQFWLVRDSIHRVRDGGGGCGVKLGFSTLRSA